MLRKKRASAEIAEGFVLSPWRFPEWFDKSLFVRERKAWLDYIAYEGAVAVRAGDPILLLKVFCMARTSNAVPPKAVLDWLSNKFAAFLESEGRVSLDSVMGMAGGAHSVSAVKLFHRNYIKERNDFFLYDLN